MSSEGPGEPCYRYVYENSEIRWAILVSLPVGYKGSHDFIPISDDDGETALTFATEADARAAATSPKYGPLLARIDYPWRIAPVVEPFPSYWPCESEMAASPRVPTQSVAARTSSRARKRRTRANAPLDLMAVQEGLGGMIWRLCWDLSFKSIPVALTFVDTRTPHVPSASLAVPTDIARALWAQGLPALRDTLDAALDPTRQVDAVSQLGLPRDFRPNVAVMVYQFWYVPEIFDGRLQKRKVQSFEPRSGVPHMLQTELRAHGCVPVVAEDMVLPWTDYSRLACTVRPRYLEPPSILRTG